jgi:uncharacterized protein DUF6510
MDAVDGNAIGGLLVDVFGGEMTLAGSICGTCGAFSRFPSGQRVACQDLYRFSLPSAGRPEAARTGQNRTQSFGQIARLGTIA